MQIRFQNSPAETKGMNTAQLRENFLVEGLMEDDKVNLYYSHYDRVIIGGARPSTTELQLHNPGELKATHFLERREMGIINVGGKGIIKAGGNTYELDILDCLYLGRGTRDISFISTSNDERSVFYLLSAPAHQTYPSKSMKREEASPLSLGEISTSNKRIIYKYIHTGGIQSCQLVMGLTVLEEGSVWNSVPPHTHTRRMEVYFYFEIKEGHRVFHFMGEPQESRHLLVNNHQAVISAPWSVHFGSGTSNYGFIWGMAGENQEFTDMDPVPVAEVK